MNLNEDFVPINLDECLDVLEKSLSKEEVDMFKLLKENDLIKLHNTSSKLIITYWSLYDKSTRLVLWFKDEFKIFEPHHIAFLILYHMWCKLNEKEPDNDKYIKMMLKKN